VQLRFIKEPIINTGNEQYLNIIEETRQKIAFAHKGYFSMGINKTSVTS
jgi:hypothetical protein